MTEIPFRPGQTALNVPVPEAEPIVAEFRRNHDRAASYGVPAHVTVLFPFLPVDRVDDGVLGELRRLVGSVPSFELRFERTGRFPDVLFLVPRPGEPLRELTSWVAARWPECPAYGGQFADVVPHLTVAQSSDHEILDRIERVVTARLAVRATVSTVSLIGFDGHRWNRQHEFRLG
ncbi:MAG: 2'-5' RNA ligase family protein [Jiangellaceae bacterium]